MMLYPGLKKNIHIYINEMKNTVVCRIYDLDFLT